MRKSHINLMIKICYLYLRNMLRYITIFLVFLFAFSQVQAQGYYDESDTSEYIPAFERDTSSRVHAGAIGGLHYRGVVFKANSNPQYSDSVGNWNNDPQIGFSFGIIVNTRLNDHLDFVSGLNFMVSKLQMSFTRNGENIDQFTNYSTLQIPLWLNYAPKKKANRLYFGLGTILTTDVSRRDEKLNRTILFNGFNMLVGSGVGFRKRLPTYFNLNFELQVHYSLLNLVADEPNYYNQAMETLKIWDISFYISID